MTMGAYVRVGDSTCPRARAHTHTYTHTHTHTHTSRMESARRVRRRRVCVCACVCVVRVCVLCVCEFVCVSAHQLAHVEGDALHRVRQPLAPAVHQVPRHRCCIIYIYIYIHIIYILDHVLYRAVLCAWVQCAFSRIRVEGLGALAGLPDPSCSTVLDACAVQEHAVPRRAQRSGAHPRRRTRGPCRLVAKRVNAIPFDTTQCFEQTYCTGAHPGRRTRGTCRRGTC